MITDVMLISSYISCFLGILCFFLVYVYNKANHYSNILMLACIFSSTMVIFSWTFFKGIIPIIPGAEYFVIGFPFYFLAGSLLYLYVKAVVTKAGRKFSWSDLYHIIPFVISVFHALYIFSASTEYQRESFEIYMQDQSTYNDGNLFFFPMTFHKTLAYTLWAYYIYRIIQLLEKVKRENKDWIIKNIDIWKWVNTLTVISIVGLVFFIINSLFSNNELFLKVMNFPIILFLVCSSIFVMFYPKVLYGPKFRYEYSYIEDNYKKNRSKTLELSSDKVDYYNKVIQNFVNTEKVYLRKNYTLNEMSRDVDIPIHHLSYMINTVFGTNYTNYINSLRIEFVIRHRFHEDFIHFSLEGISKEAGFTSRTTFYKAFKSTKGVSPSDYFKNMKEQ